MLLCRERLNKEEASLLSRSDVLVKVMLGRTLAGTNDSFSVLIQRSLLLSGQLSRYQEGHGSVTSSDQLVCFMGWYNVCELQNALNLPAKEREIILSWNTE